MKVLRCDFRKIARTNDFLIKNTNFYYLDQMHELKTDKDKYEYLLRIFRERCCHIQELLDKIEDDNDKEDCRCVSIEKNTDKLYKKVKL